MPFSPNFTVSQIPSNPALLVIDDTSTGVPVNTITTRLIYITNYNGDAVVPQGVTTAYIPWALPGNSITINLLSQDAALNIRVEWLAGSTVEGTVNTNYCFSQYSKQFLYYLIQLQSLTYNIIQDNNYWGNVGIFWTNVVGAINSVEVGNDIYSSQVCLNRANFMAQNQAIYF